MQESFLHTIFSFTYVKKPTEHIWFHLFGNKDVATKPIHVRTKMLAKQTQNKTRYQLYFFAGVLFGDTKKIKDFET